MASHRLAGSLTNLVDGHNQDGFSPEIGGGPKCRSSAACISWAGRSFAYTKIIHKRPSQKRNSRSTGRGRMLSFAFHTTNRRARPSLFASGRGGSSWLPGYAWRNSSRLMPSRAWAQPVGAGVCWGSGSANAGHEHSHTAAMNEKTRRLGMPPKQPKEPRIVEGTAGF